ncbi:MAG TPA: glycosyltransferase [Planctomycetota bacterium]|nr:glycosyltransferase [Planctomycetota bacterium]
MAAEARLARALTPISRAGVVFLVEDERSASARTRGTELLPGLAREGIEARVEALARGALARRRQLAGLARDEVVVLGRKLLAEGDLARLRRAARALVFDLDDALPERPSDSGKRGRSWSRPRRFADALRAADLVVAGSGALRDLASRHPRVRLLPVSVEIPASVPARGEGDGTASEVRLLWTGSRATLPYLERLASPLAAVARRHPRVVLEAVCDARPALPCVFTDWTLESEKTALARAEIGLHPLAADAWSRGKCGLKLALYLAWGIPAVSSRAGAGAELLDAPRAGLLADDDGEWLSALARLVSSPALRRAMGAHARAEAAARLSLEARVRSWAAVLREARDLASHV